MFNKLFGSGGAPKQQAPTVNAEAAQNGLDNQIENIQMRVKKLEKDKENYTNQARTKAKAGDKRAAGMMLKKRKMVDTDLVKLEGMLLTMEQQQNMMTNIVVDKGAMQAMAQGSSAIKDMMKEANIDKFEDIQDDLQENQA